MPTLREVRKLGQSIWLDDIRRSFTETGQLRRLVAQGLGGVTSNPAIFEKAIANSDDYDRQLAALNDRAPTVEQAYEALVIRDIQAAADALHPVYEGTDAVDGYVSLEVNPELARDVRGTIREAQTLFSKVDRPNLMIKVPATKEGMEAIEELISVGINVNVTLLFTVPQYEQAAHAYLAGLGRLKQAGGDLAKVASVASVFVSRMDSKIDQRLSALDDPKAESLRGRSGIANAKLVYRQFGNRFSGARWHALEENGARVQRPLWASTSTKDPAYPDTLYANSLIGSRTVNTLPPDTLDAFLDHGTVSPTLDSGVDEEEQRLEDLTALGIDLAEIGAELLQEGLDKFVAPYVALLQSIERKMDRLSSGHGSTACDSG